MIEGFLGAFVGGILSALVLDRMKPPEERKIPQILPKAGRKSRVIRKDEANRRITND